MNTAITII